MSKPPSPLRPPGMTTILLDVSMSLDGFTAGPNVRAEAPLGDGGEHLHGWMFGANPVDLAIRKEVDARVGAVVLGRRTFDLGLIPWGGTPWPRTPSFVVTHRPRPDLVGDNGGTFAFLDDPALAVRRARDAAGDKDVFVMGADIAGQVLAAGLLDEVHLHLSPILLGTGTPVFGGKQADLVPDGEPVAGAANHLRYRVAR
jgi:dihydrofolate reductase